MNPDRFENLAQAAIDGDATDAQLEAFESLILESEDGADQFREVAEERFSSEMAIGSSQQSEGSEGSESSESSESLASGSPRPSVRWGIVIGAGAFCAAACLALGLVVIGIIAGSSLKTLPVAAVSPEPNSGSQIDGLPEVPAEVTIDENAAVPEPSTALLLVSGSVVMLLRRRRT